MRETINITRGTDVVLNDRLIYQGATFDPSLAVNLEAHLVSRAGVRTPLGVQIIDDYLVITIPWVTGRVAGLYGLEVRGVTNGLRWATYADSLIRYTAATVEGDDPGVVVTADAYDITQQVSYRYGESPIAEVQVSVRDTVGNPRVSASYLSRVLSLVFDGLKGNGITSLVQTAESAADGGTNVWTATLDNGAVATISVRNGSRGNGIASVEKIAESFADGGVNTWRVTESDGRVTDISVWNGGTGPQGETCAYEPNDPNTPVFQLATTPGQDQTKAMTQKGVTDLQVFSAEEIDLTAYNQVKVHADTSTGKWAASSSYSIFPNVIPGETYRITPRDNERFHAFFLIDAGHTSGQAPNYAGGITVMPGWSYAPLLMTAPPNAARLYIRKSSGSGNSLTSYLPLLERITFQKEVLTDVNASLAGLQERFQVSQVGLLRQIKVSALAEHQYYYINSSDLWTTVNALGTNACMTFAVEGGETLKVVSKDDVSFNIEFLKTLDGIANNVPIADFLAGDGQRLGSLRGTHYLRVPDDARFVYMRRMASGEANMLPAWIGYVDLINDVVAAHEERLNDTEMKLDCIVSDIIKPGYRYGAISSNGYSASQGNKVSTENAFGQEIALVKVVNPSPDKTKFNIYTIDSENNFSPMKSSYVTEGFSFVPVMGTKYVVRVCAVADNTKEELDKLTAADYPYLIASYADVSEKTLGGDSSDPLEPIIANAKYVTEGETPFVDSLGLLHFSDLHGDSDAAVQILKWRNKWVNYIDDVLNTGDMVQRVADGSGSDYPNDHDWWRNCGLPEIALNLIGNHDGALNDGNDTAYDKANGSWTWNAKGKAWDYDQYIGDYIAGKGITMPTGYDDSSSRYYKSCFWHKDYPAKKIRLIALDCMHRFDGIVDPATGLQQGNNAGLKEEHLTTEQEEWLVARLNETLDSNNAAYGYSVVVACHYPLDDFSGANARAWAERSHDYTDFNRAASGGYVMDYKTQEATNWHYYQRYPSFEIQKHFGLRNNVDTGYSLDGSNFSKGSQNNFGNILSAWMDRGGKFVVWLSGHVHCNMLFYPTKFPNLLVCATTMAGSLTGTNAEDRTVAKGSANYVAIDTMHGLLKLVKLGHSTNRYLTPINYLCYDYINKKIINEG